MFGIDTSDRRLKDAARLSLQSAAAAAAMFSLMQSLGLSEKFVGVLSAVLVVQPSVGSTMGAAWDRLAATLVGCVIGVICLFALPDGYGTAVALAISMLVMNGIAAFRADWRYGVVAAVALALGAESDAVQTALDRSIAIGAGVAVGILISLVVWPERSSTRAERHVREALRAAEGLLKAVLADAGDGDSDGDERSANARRFLRELSAARDTAEQVRIADNSKLMDKIDAVEQFRRGILVLNRVADETDDILGDSESHTDPLQAIGNQSCDIISALISGDSVQNATLESVRDELERLRETLSRGSESPESHIMRNAVVFGLDEVETSLTRLVELYGGED